MVCLSTLLIKYGACVFIIDLNYYIYIEMKWLYLFLFFFQRWRYDYIYNSEVGIVNHHKLN